MMLAASIPTGTLAPTWVVIPLAFVTLLVVGSHVLATSRAAIPASRRRIRVANGVIMLATIPLATHGLAFAPLDRPSSLLLWTLIAGLVTIVLLLACLDIVNSMRLGVIERRLLRRHLHQARGELARITGANGRPPEPRT